MDMRVFDILTEYCNYMLAVLGRSPLTVKEYKYDLISFFRYLKRKRGIISDSIPFEEIPIHDIDVAFIDSVTTEDILSYLVWLNRKKQLAKTSRARKIASMKSFYKYCEQKRQLISHNPTVTIEVPKAEERIPKFLTLEESKHLIDTAYASASESNARDYCMLVLFLNCGMRLSELRGINIDKIKGNIIKYNISGTHFIFLILLKCLIVVIRHIPIYIPPIT